MARSEILGNLCCSENGKLHSVNIHKYPATLMIALTTWHTWQNDKLPCGHLTPISWECVHKLTSLELDWQLISCASLPMHSTLVSHILPDPRPNSCWLRDTEPSQEESATYYNII